jgi:hypothetical protein
MNTIDQADKQKHLPVIHKGGAWLFNWFGLVYGV